MYVAFGSVPAAEYTPGRQAAFGRIAAGRKRFRGNVVFERLLSSIPAVQRQQFERLLTATSGHSTPAFSPT